MRRVTLTESEIQLITDALEFKEYVKRERQRVRNLIIKLNEPERLNANGKDEEFHKMMAFKDDEIPIETVEFLDYPDIGMET